MSKHNIIIDKVISKMKKAFFKAWKDRGLWNIFVKDMTKGNDAIIKELKDVVLPQMPKFFIEAMEETIDSNDYPKWMEKYKTEDIATKVMKGFEEISKTGEIPFQDRKLMELLYDAYAITENRKKKLRFEKGIISDDVKVLDEYLFPDSSLKSLPDGRVPFTIDKWEELRIEITDKSNVVTFRKLLDSKSVIDKFHIAGGKIGITGKLIEFLEACATSQRRGTFHYPFRKHKSRLDIKLRALFGINAESVISVQGKNNTYKPQFQISHYDENGRSRYGNLHSNNTRSPIEGVYTMEEDDHGYTAEE